MEAVLDVWWPVPKYIFGFPTGHIPSFGFTLFWPFLSNAKSEEKCFLLLFLQYVVMKILYSPPSLPLIKGLSVSPDNCREETGDSVGPACWECGQALAWDRTSLHHNRTLHHCPLIFSPQSSHFDSHWQQHRSQVHDTVSTIRASQGSTESAETRTSWILREEWHPEWQQI